MHTYGTSENCLIINIWCKNINSLKQIANRIKININDFELAAMHF